MNVELDPWVLVCVAVLVVAVFFAGLAVPRRPYTVSASAADIKLDAISQRLTGLETQQAQTDHDVRGIRTALKVVPTARDVLGVAQQVSHLTGKVEGMGASLNANTHSLELIKGFLLQAAAEDIVKRRVKEAGEAGDNA